MTNEQNLSSGEPAQPQSDPSQPQNISANEQPSTESLQKKLKSSRIINIVLAAALVFVGGSYTALILQPNNAAAPGIGAPQGGGTGAGQDSTGEEGTGQTGNAQDGTAQQGSGQQGSDDQAQQPEVTAVTAEMIESQSYMAIGSDDAPVTLYEWTDYTCPYCGVFNRETLPDIITEYVDSGKVRIVLHDVTYIGAQAEDAAVAARAAGLQDKYFDYLFEIYELGKTNNKPNLDQATLFGLAEGLDLDLQKFEADFEDTDLRTEVQQSTLFAQTLGVAAVPFFVASGTGSLAGMQDLRGAQSIEQFRTFLDQQIAAATS